MTQDQLNQLVADATGEDLAEIQHRGFSMLEPDAEGYEADPLDELARFVDWDEADRHRNVAIVEQPPFRRAA